ncbi:MAG: sigma 54-interacting transcriptional regulator [Nitrospinales bacterium]
MKKQLLLGLGGALIAIVLAAGLDDLFRSWELKTYDFRLRLRGAIETAPALVMVDADDAAAARYGRWPWDRSVHAAMIDFLNSRGAGVIAYDILFARPDDHNSDLALVGAVKSAGNVIFPAAVSLSESADTVGARADGLSLKNGISSSPAAADFFAVGDAILPLPQLALEAGALGHIAANRDADGVVRRVPLLVRYGGELMPSLALQAVLNYLSVPASGVGVVKGYIILERARFPETGESVDLRIPIDDKGQMLINYAGRWTETFKHASFASVLADGPSDRGEDLRGRLVLVSNTLSGHDIKPIPIEKDFPGGGIHANIINTLLTRNFLRETHKSTDHTLILLLCLATAAVFGRRSYFSQAGLFLSLAAGYPAVNLALFNAGWVAPLFTPLFAMALTALLVSVYRTEEEKGISDVLLKEKRRVESHLESISANLSRKEEELEKIGLLLHEMREGIEKGRRRGEEQTQKIAGLQHNLQLVLEDKERLQKERRELENKVLDLRVHISFDEVRMEGELERLRAECLQFGIITQNREVLEMFRTLKQSAGVTSAILILGESGTGKELFARALHQLSGRRDKRFIAVNMAAIPEALVESELFGHARGAFTGAVSTQKGKFAEADEGTLFLDEIGDVGKDIQVKLLRVLQDKEVQPVGGTAFKVDVRIVAATHKNLQEEIAAGRFRDDLYYRLNTITVTLPALRERKEDIPILVRHFMERYRAEYGKNIQGISDRAMETLLNHPWRGNIRELENIVQRGITLCETELVREKDLGLEAENGVPAGSRKTVTGREGDEILLGALRENRFEIKETAVRLNMSRNTVASRFKGICFDLLVKNRLDREKTAREICRGGNSYDLVLQRIAEYHDNLIQTAREFTTAEEAVMDALKRAKNLPIQYHASVEDLVRHSFD